MEREGINDYCTEITNDDKTGLTFDTIIESIEITIEVAILTTDTWLQLDESWPPTGYVEKE